MSSAANIIGRITVNQKDIYEINDNPTTAPGIPAPVGSIAMRNNAGVGEEWLKTGAADPAWSQVSTGAGAAAWLLAGNVLTGVEFLGSTNAFDVIVRTNNVEHARFVSASKSFSGGNGSGTIVTATGLGAFAYGTVNPGGTITASGEGSWAGGSDNSDTGIAASGLAALAMGRTTGEGSSIVASGIGSMAKGVAQDGAVITAAGLGTVASGSVTGPGSTITVAASLSGGGHAFGAAIAGGTVFADDAFVLGGANGAGSAISSVLLSLSHGLALAGGSISSTGAGCTASGVATGAGSTISASSFGSLARGSVSDGADITASNQGSQASGWSNLSGSIVSNNLGSLAHGAADDGGTLSATAQGAVAFGSAVNSASTILSGGVGSFAGGSTTNGGFISSIDAALAFGFANAGSNIGATGVGSVATGYIDGDETSVINATTLGSHAQGYVTDAGSSISSTGLGSRALGSATNGFSIIASAEGATAQGAASGASITASAIGSTAIGEANTFDISASSGGALAGGSARTGTISASAPGTLAWGDSLDVTGVNAHALGLGHANTSDYSAIIGTYALVTGVAGAAAATDTLLAAGNGVVGVPANAFEIQRDGKSLQTAAEIHAIRLPAQAAVAVSARTDRTIILDTSGALGPFAVTLPAGETGLKFTFGNVGTGAGTTTYNLVANGGDLFDANVFTTIVAGAQPLSIQFIGGTWYQV